ncbi:hypothetical protein PG997_005414 [Apiospora hydei]|uniref:Uncharacterized protein n=1 Tax=Apiospora hydei TaxID=1337664 RepID=A0ABR1X4X1_9PEZI
MSLGISLLIGALSQHATLGLYHFHIVYDVVNFTGVSAAAAVATAFKRPEGFFFSKLLMSVYMCLYLAFTIVFGSRLRWWDDGISGQCYNTNMVSAPDAAHPNVDIIYLSITALYLFSSLILSRRAAPGNSPSAMERLERTATRLPFPLAYVARRFVARYKSYEQYIAKARQYLVRPAKPRPEKAETSLSAAGKTSRFQQLRESLGDNGSHSLNPYESSYGVRSNILEVAMIQYPVHGYMVYALRASNERFLSGSSENEWGFGQIVALVLVVTTLLECVKAWARYQLSKDSEEKYVSTGTDPPSSQFLRTWLLAKDEPSGPVLPSNRSKGLGRRQSLPLDFKAA